MSVNSFRSDDEESFAVSDVSINKKYIFLFFLIESNIKSYLVKINIMLL